MSSLEIEKTATPAGYRQLLWLILCLTTLLDTILIVGMWKTHGPLFWWWLIQKAQADAMIAFLLVDLVLLRLGLFMLAMFLLDHRGTRSTAIWFTLTPLVGAPALYAGIVAGMNSPNSEH